jgi:hypothetical protein
MNQHSLEDGRSVADASSFLSLEYIWHDVRFAVRSLLKAPAFTVVAILVIAVGTARILPSSPLLIQFSSSPSRIRTRNRSCIW